MLNLAKIKSVCLAAILILALALPVYAGKKVQIKDVDFKGTVLSIKHDSFGDIRFKRRIYDDPPRLVFDILDGQLGDKSLKFDLPSHTNIKRVRVAQFDKDTVRVVTEAKNVTALEKVRIENIGQTLFFKFVVKDIIIQNIAFDDGDLRIVSNGAMVPRSILLDNPERMIVDLIGARLKSSSQAKKIINGDETIKIAQFDASIVRIVFSGKKSHKREVRISNNERQLLILGKDRREGKDYKSGNKVLSLKLVKTNKDESVFSVESTKELNYKFLKLHNPERLVVDLMGLNYDESFGADQIPETAHVSDVRFGLATLGRPVTRVVFDLKSRGLLEEFKETNGGKRLLIRMVGLADDKVKGGVDVEKANKSAGTVVVIDAGHGGYDYGAIYGGYNEKDITLSISRKVADYLEAAGIKPYMVRTEDRFIALAERVEVSNSIHPRIFVSIHVNALATNPDMNGLQTYYYSKRGYKIGSYIHKQLLKDIGMTDSRVRRANFWVTKYTNAPSVLLELGFMTNVKERKKLVRDSYQTDLAKAIARGIIKYLEENK